MGILRLVTVAAALSLGIQGSFAQIGLHSAAEIEQRNAAAAFAVTREMGLALLLGECKRLMASSEPSMERIARSWVERNRDEMEAAYAWIDRYLADLKVHDPSKYQSESRALIQAGADAALQLSRIHFRRSMPTKVACEHAAKAYVVPQLDLKSLALNPGFEQFAEFPKTLQRIRSEPKFTVPSHLRLGYEKLASPVPGITNLGSLDAAEAAKERGDGPGRMAIFRSMAEEGDGSAAQTVGIMLLDGQQVPKSHAEAYRWFYAAWTLSDFDGLNALGVMLRDGLGVDANLPLAQAAFLLAKTAARHQASFDRAQTNAARLAPKIGDSDAEWIACLSLRTLDSALRKPIEDRPSLTPAKSIFNPDRRLGSLVRELSAGFHADSCKH